MARNEAVQVPRSGTPTRLSVLWLHLRVLLLRGRRLGQNALRPVPRLGRLDSFADWREVAVSRTPLRGATEGEQAMEEGKVQNLRMAARALDGLVIPAGSVFSFWRQVGRCSRLRGYVPGRQLQEGCLVRAVGGGICQLSNALYEVALGAGCEILERHPHTRIVPGSAAERNLDATVAWNHIDLRWRAGSEMRLRVRLSGDSLEVSLQGQDMPNASTSIPNPFLLRPSFLGSQEEGARKGSLRTLIDPTEHGCGACDQVACHMHAKGRVDSLVGRAAVMVDEYWPEFEAYLLAGRGEKDVLFVPTRRVRRESYPWALEGWSDCRDALGVVLRRSFVARRLASQGAARQVAKLDSFDRLARAYGRSLPPDVRHVTVALDLLPFLWRDGHLGGRTFDVLMTRHPIDDLQARLDAAMAARPERKLLGDFRAPASLIALEREALAAARLLVTPHSDVVRADPRRVQIPWVVPSGGRGARVPRTIAFCGPTVARKGAYEVREAARALGLTVVRMGSDLEGPDFWAGVSTRRGSGASWLDGVDVVVQPSVLEDRPRLLLQAIAAGVPVIATPACGVEDMPGVTTIPVGDVEALKVAIVALAPSQ